MEEVFFKDRSITGIREGGKAGDGAAGEEEAAEDGGGGGRGDDEAPLELVDVAKEVKSVSKETSSRAFSSLLLFLAIGGGRIGGTELRGTCCCCCC